MAKAEIISGICGFNTTVEARMDSSECHVSIESDCKSIRKLASAIDQVDPFQEISFRGEGPQIFRTATTNCAHTACPVPVGIIKAIEIEAGLALPADVTIKLSKS